MKHTRYGLLLLCLLAATTALFAQSLDDIRKLPQYEPDRILLKYRPGQSPATADPAFRRALAELGVYAQEDFFPGKSKPLSPFRKGAIADRARIRRMEEELSRIYVLRCAGPVDIPAAIRALEAFSGIVEYAETYPRFYPVGNAGTAYVPNDSMYAQQRYLKTMQAEQAWDVDKGDTTMVIAISDTGIEWFHPDLQPNIFINTGETGLDTQGRDKRSNGIDDDNDGKVDDWHGWDFAAGPSGTGQDNDPSGGASHGTSVAGLIGTATDNRIGLASIGFKCRILPLKIGTDNGSSLSISTDVFDYPLRLGARVFNASWGSFSYQKSFSDYLDYVTAMGMLVVGGAGNHGSSVPFYPASYPSVLGAGVCTADDIISPASAYGPTVKIMTPADGSQTISPGGGYTTWGGVTSAAAPIGSGLAGLVSHHFPQYTAEQVRERIRVTCDNIDAKNPTKAKFASSGRVNAYRALTDPEGPALRIDSTHLADPNGNNILEAGEVIGVTAYLHNFLAATSQPVNLTLVPITNASAVEIVKGTAAIASIGTGAEADNGADMLTFRVAQSTNYDATVMFRIDIKVGNYEDFGFFSALVNPSWQTLTSGSLSLTLPADGSLGWRDYPDNLQGFGMLSGINPLMTMGGLLIGTDTLHLLDAVRSGATGTSADYTLRDNDFRLVQATTLAIPGARAAREATAAFDDASAPFNRRLHLRITMKSFAFDNPALRDMIFTRYTVRNDSSGAIAGLRLGLYIDCYNNLRPGKVAFDSLRLAGYCTKSSYPVAGTFVLDSLPRSDPARPTFWAVDNATNVPGNPWGTRDGFTRAEKWQALSSFAGRPTATGIGTGGGDVGYVIAGRSFDLAPGASAEVLFGHFAGSGPYAALTGKIDSAIAYWRGASALDADQPAAASDWDLSAAYPNPLSPSSLVANVRFSVPAEAQLRIALYDLLGREVAVAAEGVYPPGMHEAKIPAAGLPAGMYVVRMTASAGAAAASRERKLLILR